MGSSPTVRTKLAMSELMTNYCIEINEPHPQKPGCFRKYYATVDVAMAGGRWVWIQIDENSPTGQQIGNSFGPFDTEGHAIADAEKNFGGLII